MIEQGANTTFVISLLAALAAGAALGFAYLLGLWYTVRRQATLRHPGLWLMVSVVGRLALLLGGFYLVMAGSWQRLLACMAGFLVVRVLLTRRLGPKAVAEREVAR